MTAGLVWSDDGEVALVAAYWRCIWTDYLAGPERAG